MSPSFPVYHHKERGSHRARKRELKALSSLRFGTAGVDTLCLQTKSFLREQNKYMRPRRYYRATSSTIFSHDCNGSSFMQQQEARQWEQKKYGAGRRREYGRVLPYSQNRGKRTDSLSNEQDIFRKHQKSEIRANIASARPSERKPPQSPRTRNVEGHVPTPFQSAAWHTLLFLSCPAR